MDLLIPHSFSQQLMHAVDKLIVVSSLHLMQCILSWSLSPYGPMSLWGSAVRQGGQGWAGLGEAEQSWAGGRVSVGHWAR